MLPIAAKLKISIADKAMARRFLLHVIVVEITQTKRDHMRGLLSSRWYRAESFPARPVSVAPRSGPRGDFLAPRRNNHWRSCQISDRFQPVNIGVRVPTTVLMDDLDPSDITRDRKRFDDLAQTARDGQSRHVAVPPDLHVPVRVKPAECFDISLVALTDWIGSQPDEVHYAGGCRGGD